MVYSKDATDRHADMQTDRQARDRASDTCVNCVAGFTACDKVLQTFACQNSCLMVRYAWVGFHTITTQLISILSHDVYDESHCLSVGTNIYVKE